MVKIRLRFISHSNSIDPKERKNINTKINLKVYPHTNRHHQSKHTVTHTFIDDFPLLPASYCVSVCACIFNIGVANGIIKKKLTAIQKKTPLKTQNQQQRPFHSIAACSLTLAKKSGQTWVTQKSSTIIQINFFFHSSFAVSTLSTNIIKPIFCSSPVGKNIECKCVCVNSIFTNGQTEKKLVWFCLKGGEQITEQKNRIQMTTFKKKQTNNEQDENGQMDT